MTATEKLSSTPRTAVSLRVRRTGGALAQLARLYLVSRRAPAALALLAGLAALLSASLYGHWTIAGGAAAQEFFPLTIEAGAAAVIAVTTASPFGEPERAAGRWLPWLRLGAAVALTSLAVGAFAAAATAGALPGGILALLRNLGGVTGVGLLAATALSGSFGWTGPMAYLVITEAALAHRLTTPWIWAAYPPHDTGAALCAALIFAAGLLLVTIRGDRDRFAR